MRRTLVSICGAIGLAAMLGLAAPVPAAGSGATPHFERVNVMRVDGSLVIDTEGKVESVEIDTALEDAIRQPLLARILAWRFKPVLVEGQPRRARAALRVTLAASRREGAEGYVIRLDNVLFPGENDDPAPGKTPRKLPTNWTESESARFRAVSMTPPRYPPDLMRAGVSGQVLLGLRVGADGGTESVEVVQSALYDVRGRDRNLAAATKLLERAALAEAKRWRFEVEPRKPVLAAQDMTATTTVVFLMEDVPADPEGQWRAIVRTPKQALSWLPAGSGVGTPGVADVGRGETLPVASALELASDVIGATL